jgi:hypothetical protein
VPVVRTIVVMDATLALRAGTQKSVPAHTV